MPDLVQQANALKRLPDQALQSELANPTGAVPGYLVLAEAQRRATLRSGAQQNQTQPGSVYDDLVRGMNPAAPPPTQAPGPPGMTPAPQGLGALGSTPPPGNFKPPQPAGMAEGGEVDDGDDFGDDDATMSSTGSASRAMPGSEFDPYINDSAQRYGVPADFVRRVVKAESNFNPRAQSPKGAMGLMQVLPGTGRDMGVTNLADPQQNIDAGTHYLRYLHDRYGDWQTATAAYNAGMGRVDKYGGVPPFRETRNYLKAVQPPTEETATAAPAPPVNPQPSLAPDATPTAAPLPEPPIPGAPPPLPDVLGGTIPLPPIAPPAAQPAVLTAQPTMEQTIRGLVRENFPDLDQSGIRSKVAELEAQAAKLGKKSFGRMLSDFGWGMASATAPVGIFGQIGAGGAAMNKAQEAREDQARKMQLELLGVDASLDKQVQTHQEAIAKATETAALQMQKQQTAQQSQTTKNRLKGRNIVGYQDVTDTVPVGYEAVPDPDNPGKQYIVTPGQMLVSADLARLTRGLYKEGDKIPYSVGQGLMTKLATIKQGGPNAIQVAAGIAGLDLNDQSRWSPADWQKIEDIQKPQVKFSPAQIDAFAQDYATTGKLPNLGMGTSGVNARQAILGKAADIVHGQGTTLASLRASGLSDMDALKKLTAMQTSVEAFEGTANANLDQMLLTAKPLIDSGSPWINKPLREVQTEGFGDKELAAYRAARQVALTEIAKVTNNPSLSGQLSDSARKEVTELLPENATLGQIYSVAKILKQDMANRHLYLQNEREKLQQRLGTPITTPVTPPLAPVKDAHRTYQGRDYVFDGKQWVGQ
jgi:hypothetical protein